MASRKVPITLTWMVVSVPSAWVNSANATPAFSRTASMRSSSVLARLAKARMESFDARSSGQTWTTPVRPVADSMVSLAASPLEVDRTAMMTRAAPSRTKCFAASRPMPVLLPETMNVWPVQSLGTMGRFLHWAATMLGLMLMFAAVECNEVFNNFCKGEFDCEDCW